MKGFYSLMAVFTVLCGIGIFITFVWYPFIIRYARMNLQELTDQICQTLSRELPFNFLDDLRTIE
ncbi:MAG: hypothetical protein NZT61_05760, partial [Deltaproteobacteria bacterium]|nr:hypothetical protein [Deltaproteobacteria bacterium]